MTNMISKTMHSIGDSTGMFARRVGDTSVDLAKRAGDSVVDVAKRIGPKRGLIGLAIFGVVLGGSIILVRYLRARGESEEEEATSGDEESATMQGEGGEKLGTKAKFRKSAKRRQHANAH